MRHAFIALALAAGISCAETKWKTSGSGDLRLRGENWEDFGFVDDNEDSFFLSRLRLRGAPGGFRGRHAIISCTGR